MLKELLESESVLEKGDLVFGIYLNRDGKMMEEYVLTLGGYNGEYIDGFEVDKYFVEMVRSKRKSNY